MSQMGSLDGERIAQPSRLRQFLAIMYKNVIVQIRSRHEICGIRLGGVASVVLDICIPVIFIAVMGALKGIPEVDTYPLLFKEIPLRDADWEFPHFGATSGLSTSFRRCTCPRSRQCLPRLRSGSNQHKPLHPDDGRARVTCWRFFDGVHIASKPHQSQHLRSWNADRGVRKLLLAPRTNRTAPLERLLAKALACSPAKHAHSGSGLVPQPDDFGSDWRVGLPWKCLVSHNSCPDVQRVCVTPFQRV
jgi:hypothetical protein